MTANTRRKSGTVASINRSRTDNVFDDDIQDDDNVDVSKFAVDMDDIYDFGSSPPRPTIAAQAQPPKRRNDPPRECGKNLVGIPEEPVDVSQRCYKDLLTLRDKVVG